jgi:hypothetical protein
MQATVELVFCELVTGELSIYAVSSSTDLIVSTVAGTKLCVSPTSLACGWKENKRIFYANQTLPI